MGHRVLVNASRFLATIGDGAAGLGLDFVRPPRQGRLPTEELIPALQGCVAAIASSERYGEEVFAACPDLRVVSRWGVGYDAVDVAAAGRHGVVVTTTRGALEESVADFTFALMLAAARRVVAAADLMRGGGWDRPEGVDVHGRCLGIVGLGRIGTAVARRANAFAMRVLAYDPYLTAAEVAERGAEAASLPDLLAAADFVVLHPTLNPSSRGLIGAAELARMRPGAWLINVARGPVVQTEALVEALAAERIAGAALDVYEEEPLPADHPLRRSPRCLLTPHMASASREAAAAMSRTAAWNIAEVLAGRRPPGTVTA